MIYHVAVATDYWPISNVNHKPSVRCIICKDYLFALQHITNGTGIICDTIDKPCACGAWHNPDEMRDKIRYMNQQLMERVADPTFGSTDFEKAVLEKLTQMNEDGTWQ